LSSQTGLSASLIVGEFGIALAFALLARTLRHASWLVAIVAGIAGGLSIFTCYAIAFLVTDQLIKLCIALFRCCPLPLKSRQRSV